MNGPFKTRVATFWYNFVIQEKSVRELMLSKSDPNLLVSTMDNILKDAFINVAFEMGINKKQKHELILSPNGNKMVLMQINYLLNHRPKELDEVWNFYSSKPAQGYDDMSLSMYNLDISPKDFKLYLSSKKDRREVAIKVYAPKLAELIDNEKYTVLFVMLDLFIGELYTMKYVGKLDFVDEELNVENVPLSKLKSYIEYLIKEYDWPVMNNPVEVYSAYRLNSPSNTRELRADIIAGYTSCKDIISDYMAKDDEAIDHFREEGLVFGFVYYENSTVNQSQMADTRAAIEDSIVEKTKPAGIAECTGGATGNTFSYIDFIIYDYTAFIRIAKEVMRRYNFQEIGFSAFRSTDQPISLI